MLCAIGISIFLKQIPLAFGYTEKFSFKNFDASYITTGAIIYDNYFLSHTYYMG